MSNLSDLGRALLFIGGAIVVLGLLLLLARGFRYWDGCRVTALSSGAIRRFTSPS